MDETYTGVRIHSVCDFSKIILRTVHGPYIIYRHQGKEEEEGEADNEEGTGEGCGVWGTGLRTLFVLVIYTNDLRKDKKKGIVSISFRQYICLEYTRNLLSCRTQLLFISS